MALASPQPPRASRTLRPLPSSARPRSRAASPSATLRAVARRTGPAVGDRAVAVRRTAIGARGQSAAQPRQRSEEHTSELQSLMRNSYAVFCLKKKKKTNTQKSAHDYNEDAH